jgi:hypothetical protein
VGNFITIGWSGILKVLSGGCKAGVVSVGFIPLLCFVVLLLRADVHDWLLVEPGQYHCAEPDDGTIGGGKDASVR